MTRASILLLAAFSTLTLAQQQVSLPVEPTQTFEVPDNLETFPSIIDDSTSAPVVPPYPTDGGEPPVYGTETQPPVYETPTEVPYPSGSSDQAPVETETPEQPGYGTETEAPVEPTPTTLETAYPPPESAPTGNATIPEPSSEISTAPSVTATFADAGNVVSVKLPVVLGALGLVFALL